MADEERPYDAGNRADVQRAQKSAAVKQAERDERNKALMSMPQFREFVYEILAGCHMYQTSFAMNALQMAHNEGERNIGLRITADLVRATPELYSQMLNEGATNG